MTSNFGTTASAITTVSAIAIDSSGGLYIANENRVLYFPAGSYNTATRVYGQLGSFTSNTTNKNGLTADSLSGVSGLSVDPAGGLYVADSGNSRVLYFRDSTSTTATQVYGSSGFTGGTNIDMTSLSDLLNVFGDASGVYVSQKGKVIYFPKDEKSHILTYGGETGAVSLTETSISLFSSNISIFVGTDGKVFISDSASHRVLMY